MTADFGYRGIGDLPDRLPVFPLDGAIVLPRAQLPLNIFEPRYLNMVDDALASPDRMIGMVQPVGSESAVPALAGIGCAGRIVSFAETGDGRYLITLRGIARFELSGEVSCDTPYRQAEISWDDFEGDLPPDQLDGNSDRESFEGVLKSFFSARDLAADWDSIKNAPIEPMVNQLSMVLPFETAEKQALLEARSLSNRLSVLVALMQMAAAESDDGPGGVQ